MEERIPPTIWSADLNGPMGDLMTVCAGVAILDFVSHLRKILAEEGET
jgi:hypothetical protein